MGARQAAHVTLTADAKRLFTDQHRTYDRFIASVGYEAGIRAVLSRSSALRSGIRVLDAGCGTGAVSLALRDAMSMRGMAPATAHALDLTPVMLDRFRAKLAARGIEGIELIEADVLHLDQLPSSWAGYDLIVSASMLEYVPRELLPQALGGLRHLLAKDGRLLLFITKRNWLTRPMIGRWWQSNLYTATEIADALRASGFQGLEFRSFPLPFSYLAAWGHVIEVR